VEQSPEIVKENLFNELDRRHIWHPYTRFSTFESDPLPVIVRGEGIYLFDDKGNRYLDAISSWWACALGHGHPRIVAAIQKQAAELQHSILGNLSHRRAIELAAKLAELMPTPARHVLFSSDGACAVEAALKISLQYWHNVGRPEKQRFAALEEGYHGDTLGAVGVGYLEHFHKPFDSVVSPAFRASPWKDGFAGLADLLKKHADKLAAVIVEPLCQGAAGMKLYPANYLRRLGELCRKQNALLIVDEIATGFGRTGRMFAFEHAGIDPDIVCVGKALSGGYLPISAAIVKDAIYETFSDKPADHSFYHGHTFCGNPIAAAAAIEALTIYKEEKTPEKATAMETLFKESLEPLAKLATVREVRCFGAIAAVELKSESPAPAVTRPQRVRKFLLDKGVLLRPLGDVVYLMPPLIIDWKALKSLVSTFSAAIRSAV
jgi:adenosylmethionine-8-amino-7-oxononanoate aminotransferase